MQSIRDIAVGYGQQVEALLERLGARGPVRGAGELLDQVKHRLDEDSLRTVRRFLRLRNKVVHNKPVEMPMPSREEVEQSGREAVAVLEGALTARDGQTNATFRPPAGGEPSRESKRQDDPPGPVYRIRERDGAYEVWVGPAGVWVAAERRAVLERQKLEVEVRLVTRFPRLRVRGVRWTRGLGARPMARLEARVRYGRRRLSPAEVTEAVRLLSRREPTEQGVQPSGSPQGPEHRMRRVSLENIPATFYVGPVGVLAVAEHALIATTEAKRVWEDSGGAISALPVVLDPRLKEPQGRVGGVLALRDEGAIKDYLRGGRLLDDDEVDPVAGWLQNRQAPVPSIRDKKGRYHLKGEEVTEGRTKAPPAFVVERVPPGERPRSSRAVQLLKRAFWWSLKRAFWRALFVPEMALFFFLALNSPVRERPLFSVVLVVLFLRFLVLFGNDELGWKRKVLVGVGGLELVFSLLPLFMERAFFNPKALSEHLWLALILIPGILSLLRAAWLSWPHGRPFRASALFRSRVR